VGPFEVAVPASLDTVARVGHSLQALGENHLASSSKMIERMVAEGQLGRRVGQGFYRYSPEGKRI
jgi:3-hydroxyacyl-CoA dehydrogenase